MNCVVLFDKMFCEAAEFLLNVGVGGKVE